jgi:hypothetical protein
VRDPAPGRTLARTESEQIATTAPTFLMGFLLKDLLYASAVLTRRLLCAVANLSSFQEGLGCDKTLELAEILP